MQAPGAIAQFQPLCWYLKFTMHSIGEEQDVQECYGSLQKKALVDTLFLVIEASRIIAYTCAYLVSVIIFSASFQHFEPQMFGANFIVRR